MKILSRIKKLPRKYFIGAIIILLIIGWYVMDQNAKKANLAEVQPYQVKKQTLLEELTLSGEVDADEKVTLRFQTGGRLAWVGVKEGDTVKKFQTLATLDKRELAKTLEKKLNDFKTQRWDLDQSRDDADGKALTDALQRTIDKEQFALDNTIRDVEIQSLALEFSNLFTPIAGIVTRVQSPYAGVNIIPTQAEIDVLNPDTLYFSSTADQTEIIKMTEGMQAEITLDAYPDTTLTGTVLSIGYTPKAGESSTVYQLKVSLPQDARDAGKYRIGMTGDINFILDERSGALSVPAQYVKEELDGSKYVFKDPEKKIKQTVKTGFETDTDIEITSGLTLGDTIYD